MEKKKIKISLGTAICIFIIVILLIVIITMYCKLRENNKELETNKEEKEINILGENDKKENVTNKLTYEIINKSSEYLDKYSERGYYIDTLNEPNAPYFYIISAGQKSSGGYSIKITDVDIDENNNVNVTVKESTPPMGTVTTMALTYPICELKLSGYPNSITIKDINGNEYKEIKQEENNNVINKIYEELEQINSLNIYTDNIEKKNYIPEKFNNENYIYRGSNIFTKI